MLCLVIPVLSLENLVGVAFRSINIRVMTMLLAGGVVFIIGLIDDLKSVPSMVKLTALLAAAFAVCFSGSLISNFSLGGVSIDLGWTAWPITMLWIVGVTVGINF